MRGPEKPESWTVAAAALAVITSIISAWSSRRVTELHEDSQRPNPYPAFDLKSLHGFALIRVRNSGGTPAYNISLSWTPELRGLGGKPIGFEKADNLPGISVLLPGESIAQYIGAHHEFIKDHPDSDYRGTIEFEDSTGSRFSQEFRLDYRSYEGTPAYDEEALKTHYELQKIPGELQALRREIQRITSQVKP